MHYSQTGTLHKQHTPVARHFSILWLHCACALNTSANIPTSSSVSTPSPFERCYFHSEKNSISILVPFFPIISLQFLISISQKIPILILNSISSNNFYFNSYFNSNSLCPSCCNTSYTTSEYMLVRKCHCHSSSAHISIQLQEWTHL